MRLLYIPIKTNLRETMGEGDEALELYWSGQVNTYICLEGLVACVTHVSDEQQRFSKIMYSPRRVKPNCGLLLNTLAGPPLKNARNPSSLSAPSYKMNQNLHI